MLQQNNKTTTTKALTVPLIRKQPSFPGNCISKNSLFRRKSYQLPIIKLGTGNLEFSSIELQINIYNFSEKNLRIIFPETERSWKLFDFFEKCQHLYNDHI